MGRQALGWATIVAMVAAMMGMMSPSATAATGPSAMPATTTAVSTPPGLVTISPTRVLDTRTDIGGPKGRLEAGSTTSVSLNGAVPYGAAAVVLNVTVTNAAGPGFVTVWSGIGAPPKTSSLNFVKGRAVANQVIATAASGGPSLYLGVSAADLVVDVTGYYPAGSAYHLVTPSRLMDTRRGREPAAKSVSKLAVTGRAGVPATGVAAVVLNVTAVQPAGAGFVTVYPAGSARPAASNLNYVKGGIVPAMAIVKLGTGGAVDIYTLDKANLVVDVAGWIASGGDYHAVLPARLLDTRSGLGAPAHRVRGNTAVTLQVTGHGGVPAAGVAAVEVNVTVVAPSQAGFATAFAGGVRPIASTLNFSTGQVVANSATVKLSSTGTLDVYAGWGTTDLVVDVVGYWTDPPSGPSGLDWERPSNIDPAQGVPDSISCPTATFCAAVDSRGNAFTYDGTNWSAAEKIDPGVAIYAISCTDAEFCVAVDQFGTALSYDGRSWSAQFIGTVTPFLTYSPMDSVSCASRDFCVAVDEYGHAATYRAGTWSPAKKIDSVAKPPDSLSSVSCPTAKFCAAVDWSGNALTFNGSKWTTPIKIDSHGLNRVSCPSSSFCVAVDQLGNVLTWRSGKWSAPVKVDADHTNQGLSSVSCAAPTFCSAVDGAGNAFTYDGTTWSVPKSIAAHSGGLTSVSCPVARSCVAVDSVGDAHMYDGASWSKPTSFDPMRGHLGSVSCPTTTYCVALDSFGRALAWNGSGWADAPDTPPSTTRMTSVSCPTTTFCAAVGTLGQAVTFDGTRWSAPVKLGTGASLRSVSCPTSAFCVAVDRMGQAYTFNGTNWSAPALLDSNGGNGLAAVSCASAIFCVAVELNGGGVVSFNGHSWTAPISVDPRGGSFTAVSCSSASFCAAVDQDGNAVIYNGTTWSKPRTLGYGEQLTSISCPSDRFCAAVTATGSALTFDGSNWEGPSSVDYRHYLTSVSCADPTVCIAVDADGRAVTGRHL